MKIRQVPKQVPAPSIDYKNYSWDKVEENERKHAGNLKAFLIAHGFDGKHTGKIFREPHADGYAQYMFADGPAAVLIHLPYGDAWHAPNVEFLPKREVLKRIARAENLRSMFAAKKA